MGMQQQELFRGKKKIEGYLDNTGVRRNSTNEKTKSINHKWKYWYIPNLIKVRTLLKDHKGKRRKNSHKLVEVLQHMKMTKDCLLEYLKNAYKLIRKKQQIYNRVQTAASWGSLSDGLLCPMWWHWCCRIR